MTAHITKLLLLFSGLLLSLSLAAQYPSNAIKSRLGWQTTGDGLTFRGSGAPAFSPGSLANAWMYLDTTNMILYGYRNFAWVRLPSANNGLNMDGAYTQLGGTLGENTQIESAGYTFDLGKISGTNKAYLQTYGSSPYYAGIYSTTGTTEASLSVGNGVWNFETDQSGNISQVGGTATGFSASYLGSFGATTFKMDSARFRILGIGSYATHALATAGTVSNQLYRIDDSRSIFINSGTGDKVSPNIFDNNTYVGILNSKPFSLGQWTTAGRPSGTTGYTGFNTTLGYQEFYDGSTWFPTGFWSKTGATINYAAGDVTHTTSGVGGFLTTTTSNSGIAYLGAATPSGGFTIGKRGSSASAYKFIAAGNSYFYSSSNDFSFLAENGKISFGSGTSSTAQMVLNSSGSLQTGESSSYSLFEYDASSPRTTYFVGSSAVGQFGANSGNLRFVGLNNTANIAFWTTIAGVAAERARINASGNLLLGTTTDVSRRLHVSGEARITDLTTDPPTQIVGADADGDLGALALSGLSISGGTLTAQNIGNTNLALTSNRTLHGAGFSLALNANTTVRDSFLIGNLPEFDSPFITIADNATGLQGKKKFLLRADSLYEYYDSYGFVAEPNTAGFQVAGDRYGYYHFADTLGFWESGMYKEVGTDGLSTIYGDISTTNDHYLIQQVEEGTSRLLWKMTDNRITLQKEGSVEVFRLTDSGDVTVGDSLRVITLPDHTDPDSIATVKGGVIGRRKWMIPVDSTFTPDDRGFYLDNEAAGVQTFNAAGNGAVMYLDTAGYFDIGVYRNIADFQIYAGMYALGYFASPTLRTQVSKNNIAFETIMDQASLFTRTFSRDLSRLDSLGTYRLHQYGTGAKEAADLSKTQSNYVAGFATDGTITDYRITRDTSTSNADFTVTSTLMSTCQELFISAEVTSGATDTVNVILPLPSSTYANKKVYVFGDDDSSTWWVATKTLLGNGLYFSDLSVKPTAQNYAAVTTTTGISGVTYCWICTRRNSGTWNWVLIQEN